MGLATRTHLERAGEAQPLLPVLGDDFEDVQVAEPLSLALLV
jgi:hypothetical protein